MWLDDGELAKIAALSAQRLDIDAGNRRRLDAGDIGSAGDALSLIGEVVEFVVDAISSL